MALGRDIEIGIDIEDLRTNAPLEIVDGYFAKAEAFELSQLRTEEQHLRFFELWTLKESYIKARGTWSLDTPPKHLIRLAQARECGIRL